MKRVLLAVATVGALIGSGALAMELRSPADMGEVPHPQRLVIGLDLSRSNPLIENPQFAAHVAQRIADIVRNLGFASEVHVRTFGNYDARSNTFAYDKLISVHSRPEEVAADVQKLIAGTPYLVKSGRWRSQGSTNILGFLDNVSHSIGCGGMPTDVILASDGIEDSEIARLTDESDTLPPPQGRPFRGCREFAIFGIGQGTRSPRFTEHLRNEWARWASRAGFGRFEGLNDW